MATTNGVDASKYIDLMYTGNVFSSNLEDTNNLVVRGSEAIKNTIKLYLMSQVGDYRRDVTRGGPMVTLIGKPLSEEYKSTIEKKIREAISAYDSIVVSSVVAKTDLESRMWIVSVSFSDRYNKIQDSINLGIPGA